MKILLTALPGPKPWNGATLYQEALGGSESAVVYLARSFFRLGHEITVLAPGQPGIFDGVTYVQEQAFNSLLLQGWDCVISSRWIEVLSAPWKTAVRVFWTHDIPPLEMRQQPAISADIAVCLSEFHVSAWAFPPDKVHIIGNGVDLSLYQGPEVERNPNVLLWTSNPDRGLPLACKIFQDIRTSWPDLELHIYGRSAVYGWPAENELPFLPRSEHSENVFLHDPLNKVGLAKVLREAWAWFYPTYWAETYCIAALEAQAAGTPVISVPLGALPETVAGGILQYDFKNAVSQLRNKSRWEKLSVAGRAFAQYLDWDVRAQQWLEVVGNAESEPALTQDEFPVALPGGSGSGTEV